MNNALKSFIANNKKGEFWPALNNVSVFLWQWNLKNYFSSFKDKTPADCLIYSNQNISYAFFNVNKLFEISKEFFINYFKDSGILKRKIKSFHEIEKEINLDYKKFNSNFIAKQNTHYLSQAIFNINKRCWISNGIVWFSVYNLEPDFFYKNIGLEITKNEVLSIWSKAITPSFPSFDKNHFLFILTLISKQNNIDTIAKACQYFYATYNYVPNLSETKSTIESEYKEYLSNPRKATLKINSLKKEQKLILEKYLSWRKTLNYKQRKINNYIQAAIKFKDLRKKTFNKSFVIAWQIANELTKRAGLEEKYIPFIFPEEYKKGIKFLAKLKPELEKRIKGFCTYIHYSGKKDIFYLDCLKARQEIDSFYASKLMDDSNKEILKGNIGSPGKIIGIVRKVLYFNNGSSKIFKEGEILVTGMTRPEFMPLMKKAAAIITDEGGITCHAAIVARELRKPCIIGTNVATQILNDGDEVEVDAYTGIVRIINKK